MTTNWEDLKVDQIIWKNILSMPCSSTWAVSVIISSLKTHVVRIHCRKIK